MLYFVVVLSSRSSVVNQGHGYMYTQRVVPIYGRIKIWIWRNARIFGYSQDKGSGEFLSYKVLSLQKVMHHWEMLEERGCHIVCIHSSHEYFAFKFWLCTYAQKVDFFKNSI